MLPSTVNAALRSSPAVAQSAIASMIPLTGGLSQMHPASNNTVPVVAPAPMFRRPEMPPGSY